MNTCVLEAQYFPCIAYLARLQHYGQVLLEAHEHYPKQTWRNRCRILAANGALSLSVPVCHEGRKVPMHQVRINYREHWQNDHWRSIASAYGKAPYFAFYADVFREEIYSGREYLLELNEAILSLCLKFLKLNVQIGRTGQYLAQYPQAIADGRNFYKADNEEVSYMQPYTQLFGNQFANNLSVLDLLFCTGPEASLYLKNIGRVC